jgi:hypothetical protein
LGRTANPLKASLVLSAAQFLQKIIDLGYPRYNNMITASKDAAWGWAFTG